MTPTQLLSDLDRRGIRVEASGNRLRYAPRSLVTPDILEQMRYFKPDLLGILNGRYSTVCCPWCRSRQLVEGREGRGWCEDCEQIAWLTVEGTEMTRADYIDREYIDPPEPCPACGSVEFWQSVAGDLFAKSPGRWRCMRCQPPRQAWRLRTGKRYGCS